MTSLGAAVQAKKILLMPADEPVAPGIYYPEHLFDHRMEMDALTHFLHNTAFNYLIPELQTQQKSANPVAATVGPSRILQMIMEGYGISSTSLGLAL
ncbi:hypothetical protein ACMX2M_20450 [Paenibacillus polymyxa]